GNYTPIFLAGEMMLLSTTLDPDNQANTIPATWIIEALRDNPEAPDDSSMNALHDSGWFLSQRQLAPKLSFVTDYDRISLRPKVFTLQLKNLETKILTIRLTDPFEASSSPRILWEKRFESDNPGMNLRDIVLSLEKLPSGRYFMQGFDELGVSVPFLAKDIYLDTDTFSEAPLAMLELFYAPGNVLGDYKWFHGNLGHLLEPCPTYSIHWKNRSTFWRYYFKEVSQTSSVQSVGPYTSGTSTTFTNILVSPLPLGLTKMTRPVEITVDEGGSTKKKHLPNPDISMIYPVQNEIINGNPQVVKKIFSEINMGGGLGPPSS
ncbi:MAG: hypothetical protein AAF696_38480, partial [Bacteroidota bacterium]